MIKKILLSVILTSYFANAQDLYVDNDSYLYARDIVLFVNNDIRLETATSNLYLRGDAQLLQNVDIKNSDLGELSIYQNQTTDVFEYNYFCSPVGVAVDGTARANLAFNGSNIHDPDDDTDLTNVVSPAYSYTSGFEGTATQLSNYWLYTLRDAEGYFNWQQIFETGAAETGYGFTLKGSPNTNNVLDFRGRPNNGTILVSCAFDGVDGQPNSGTLNTAETLTGNPYPSVLDLKLFFVNSATNQSRLSNEIFFWEQKQTNSHFLRAYEGGYGVYIPGDLSDLSDNGSYSTAPFENYNGDGSPNTITSGNTTDFSVNNSRRFAAVGQGFVIQSNGSGGDATFDNSMRMYVAEDSNPTGNGAVFAKNSNKSKTTDQLEKKIVAMSHNGVDYDAIFNTPTLIPEIRIHTRINDLFYKENVIAFRKGTPDNTTYNKSYDGASINELADDAYLISSDKALAIKSINYDENTRLNLGLKASKEGTSYQIRVNQLKEIPDGVEVFLYDNETNTYTDILNNTFEVTLDAAGTYDNRFEITFAEQSTLNTSEETFESFKIVHNDKISQLSFINPNNREMRSFSLFDTAGKQVMNQTISSSKNTYTATTKTLSSGVYVVQVKLADQNVISKKIIVQ